MRPGHMKYWPFKWSQYQVLHYLVRQSRVRPGHMKYLPAKWSQYQVLHYLVRQSSAATTDTPAGPEPIVISSFKYQIKPVTRSMYSSISAMWFTIDNLNNI